MAPGDRREPHRRFLTSKAAIPQLREAGEGALVLISSVCGLTASAGFGAYNASKHGVIGLMRTLANELGPDGVTSTPSAQAGSVRRCWRVD